MREDLEMDLAIKELLEVTDIKPEKQPNPFDKLHYSTDHLPYFHEFNSLIGLYGRHYIPIIKTRWYQLHGGILQKEIIQGNLRTDTRFHAAYPLPTEAGKNDLIYGIKSLIECGIPKPFGKTFVMSEPISYSPESLIGKYIEVLMDDPNSAKRKKIKTRIPNHGHFANDFVEFDECTDLIISEVPEKQQAREYISKAENPIGKNKIEKRLVDDLPSETISYYPKCTFSYYFQPYKKIPEQAFLQGFMRRKIIPVGNVSLFLNDADELTFSDKLKEKEFSEENYRQDIIHHLMLMKSHIDEKQFLFTEKAKQLLQDYSLYVLAQAKMHSNKISNFAKLSKFTTLSNLIKMSCILSAAYYKNEVDESAVALAFMDLVEFSQNTFNFIYEKSQGDFDYGTSWGGADYNQRKCLEVLYRCKFFSRESSKMSIDYFVNHVIMDVYKVKESQARNRYLDMRKKDLIDSAQIGKNDSRVWLKFSPNEHKEYLEGDKGFKGYNAYNTIFLTRNSILTPLKPLSPLKPLKSSEYV